MSYTDPGFWLLLAATLGVFAAAPVGWRPAALLASSLIFYGAPDWHRLIWLGAVAALGLAGCEGGRRVAQATAMILVGALVLVKFGDAAGLGLPPAPPGYSFYSFTMVAHLVDRARGQAPDTRGIPFLLHVAWFPKLLAGPIERSKAFVPQLGTLAIRPGPAALGFTLILSGLLKKLVIADNLAPVVDAAYAIPAYAAPLDLIMASYFFAFQIYCDFSGYTDLALGLSALVGLQLSRNFDRPYLSPSVTAFWSDRWHITLGRWFRDYVYIPLGGSRHGSVRRTLNLMTVFALSGLWHAGLGYGVGWGFLVWGLLNGAFVAAENLLPAGRPGMLRPLSILLTFHLVLVTWVFFRAATVSDALLILRRVAAGLADLPAVLPAYPFSTAQMMGAALIALLVAGELACRDWPARIVALPQPLRWAAWYAAMAVLLLLGRWQGAGFIYAQF